MCLNVGELSATSAARAAFCVQEGWLSPEAAAIAATEPLDQWWPDVLLMRGVELREGKPL